MRVGRKMDGAKYSRIHKGNLLGLQKTRRVEVHLPTGQLKTFGPEIQGNGSDKTLLNTIQVLKWHSQSPHLNPIQNL